ncbi:hypothetical protein ACIQMZ_05855 [Streptomyces longwoodensis]|uniref:hypothetical protein n=1 Tax=Streptomyces longwoodensis TaxID=68231 RepID=UPI00382B1249
MRSVVAEATQRISARTQQLAAAVAEAVLGRANSAEKIDLITPADIAPLSTASRAQNLDTTAAGMGAPQAKFTPLVAMPDPNGLQAVRAMTTANLFRDMSGLATMGRVLTKGIEAAATNDKAAGERAQEALKTATEHLQKMARIAVGAASRAVPAVTGGGGHLSALGGMLNQGGKTDPPSPPPPPHPVPPPPPVPVRVRARTPSPGRLPTPLLTPLANYTSF